MKRILCLVSIAAVGCSGGAKSPPVTTLPPTEAPASSAPPAVPAAPPAEEVSLSDVGIHGDWLNTKADPCSDFAEFSCGGYLNNTEIPPDKATVGSMTGISDNNEAILHDILEAAVKAGPTADPLTKKIGDFYGSCMDEAAVNAAGTKPLKPLLDAIDQVKDPKSLASAVALLHQKGVRAFFHLEATQDLKDATKMILQVDQGGLGLPDRDYYFRDDERSKKLRDEYVQHIERTLKLGGFSAAKAKTAAADIMALETSLAKASLDAVARRDEEKLYHVMDRKDLAALAPTFPWDTYLKGMGEADFTSQNVTVPDFFAAMDSVVKSTKPAVLREYLTWMTLNGFAMFLSKPFVDEAFSMEHLIMGQKELQVRWKRCVRVTDRELGELLGQPYVAKAFGADGKTLALTLVHDIADAMDHDLDTISWMDAATRAQAKVKLKAMAYLIGYPDKWRSYDVAIDPKTFGKNLLALRTWNRRYDLDQAGKPTDRFIWHMTPPTVNAYQDPQRNEMVFPAGIMQVPFFSTKSSWAANLGAMGAVVGHELTHGYDDQGAKYDPNGNLKTWWPPAVTEAFEKKTKCVADQYDAYEALPGLHVNGKLTLGENIADIGGLKLAFAAYRAATQGQRKQIASGYTEDQQFFIAFGQTWCQKASDEYTRMRTLTNPHSPPNLRIRGAVSDLPAFAEAFHCPAGTPMAPVNRCEVW